MREPRDTLLAFQTLFPKLGEENFHLKPKSLSNFPFWLRAAVEAYTLQILGNDQMEVTLVRPKEQLSFDQLTNIYRQVSDKTGPRTLLIADELSPKHRPLLVKFGIPFVFRNESIFAPNLALVFNRLKSLKAREPRERMVKQALLPFALKLLAGYLTENLQGTLSLQFLIEYLSIKGTALSRATLSNVMNELLQAGYVKTSGGGPKKSFHFLERQEIWIALRTAKLAPFMKIIQGDFSLPKKTNYVSAGESALSEYSELASPKTLTIALSSKSYKQLRLLNTSPNESSEGSIYVQVWKSDPRLFSVDGNLNPIELYFSMREHPDERIQSALEKMLSKYKLKVEAIDVAPQGN